MKLFKTNKFALTGFISAAVLLLVVAISSGNTKFDTRNRAAGTGEIEEIMTASPLSASRGANVTITLSMKKLVARGIPTSGAQAIMTIPTDIFTINSATCTAPFNGTPFVNINGSTVTLFCALSPASTPVSLSATNTAFGSISLTVKNTAALGNTSLVFTNTRVTEAGVPNESPDVSTVGTGVTIAIQNAVTVTATPVPTNNPTPVPTTIPTTSGATPTPVADQSAYTIDVGDKNSLTINIGSGNSLKIKFKTVLMHVEGHPDLVLRLRAKDDLAFTASTAPSVDTCQIAGTGSFDYYIPVKADANGVYSPNSSSQGSAPNGVTLATVESDGWVTLPGLLKDKYYTFILKGPKTRGTQTVTHAQLIGNKAQSDEFDWTASPLYPGDLPDPNNGSKQDCTVNAIDLSLMVDRQSQTDQASLDVADVTYDTVVNGNDIAKVVNTLSTKPDDD